ncbi:hypothetical protein RF55_11096 [Lasius niger]|uniref:Uncharacterized protein n=1 Tax=Lasius niger TaxID=67767 RepID=A0A0J7N9D5_LASNI|nr:hypothetical protein RF55_11096 [Lasius niger]
MQTCCGGGNGPFIFRKNSLVVLFVFQGWALRALNIRGKGKLTHTLKKIMKICTRHREAYFSNPLINSRNCCANRVWSTFRQRRRMDLAFDGWKERKRISLFKAFCIAHKDTPCSIGKRTV